MTKKTDWKDEVVDVSRLKLDLQNPRLPKYVKDIQDENNTRDYLLRKENVTRIARSIAANGYHHSAVSIAYKDSDKKLIILDGNRRLAACQLLLSPALVADAKVRKEYEDLAKEMQEDTLSNIKVTVAPTRKAAEKEIWDIHVTPSSKPWEVLQKLRMYRNLIETGDYDVPLAAKEYGMTAGKFKGELSKLYLYEELNEKTDEKGQDELLKSGFNKIERILLSNNGKKLLDFNVDDNGKINIVDADKFEANLTQLLPFIVEPNRVSAQAKQSDLIDIVYSKVDPVQFPSKQPSKASGNSPGPIPAQSPTKDPSSQGSSSKPDWVTDAEFRQYAGADRVKNILEELKLNKPTKGKNINIVAIALRVAIELAIYDVLKQKGHIQTMINLEKAKIKAENIKRVANEPPLPLLPPLKSDWTPTLVQMLNFMLDEANRIITDPQERRALEKIKNTRKEYMGDLNSYMHNVSFKPTEEDTRNIWDTFARPIFDIIRKI
ncbi:MAG TPA: ParB N-terminal domain-containing protein [Candidatus Saccharimonadales bacterium]|nr:ParB N-terminal domain-containing protein [Candidatus Saccharimonadales bacterium]